MFQLLASIGVAVAIAGAQAAFLPTGAAASQASEPAEPQSADPSGPDLVDQYFRHLYAKDYAAALVTVGKLDPDRDNLAGRGVVAAMRGGAMLGLKRDKDAAQAFAEARALAPNESFVDFVPFLVGLIADRIDVSADALDRMIARAPDAARELDSQLVSEVLRKAPKEQVQKNEDRQVALARIGFGGPNGVYLVSDAMGILLKRGDVAAAAELIPQIDDPQVAELLLIRKRFSALWPQLEAHVGPHMDKIRASSVAVMEREYSADSSNYQKLQWLVGALRYAGRHPEAIALRSKLPATPEAMSAADEPMAWAVNEVALAMHSAGQLDEADRLYATLNNAKIKNDHWLVNMKINRIELVVADGRFQHALSLLTETEASANKHGNPYAQQLVRRLRYCTLSGLGRKEEAAKLLPGVMEHAKDARAPTIDGLLCAGEIEKAEQLALDSLRDEPDFEENFLRQLQVRRLTDDDPSVWSKGWRQLRDRPAIAKEFDRLGRDLPERFALRPKDKISPPPST